MTDRAVRLVELTDDDGGLTIGGKAAGLIPPARAGLPVPAAAIVPAEADDEDLDDLAADLATRFGGAMLAVRSSGAAEDSNQASFAGQYETVLDVPAEQAALAAALRRVRDSAVGAHVTAYAAGHETAMAVLVMPMVQADAAGIAFTRDPVTGARVVVIEAVRGLADRLAAGEVVGERWTVGTNPQRLHDLGVLTPEQVLEIADLARSCEAIAGTAQDIEWAFADGALVLLQTRPISTLDEIEPIRCDDEIPPGLWEWDSAHNRRPMTPDTPTPVEYVPLRVVVASAPSYPRSAIPLDRRSVGRTADAHVELPARLSGAVIASHTTPPLTAGPEERGMRPCRALLGAVVYRGRSKREGRHSSRHPKREREVRFEADTDHCWHSHPDAHHGAAGVGNHTRRGT